MTSRIWEKPCQSRALPVSIFIIAITGWRTNSRSDLVPMISIELYSETVKHSIPLICYRFDEHPVQKQRQSPSVVSCSAGISFMQLWPDFGRVSRSRNGARKYGR